MSVAYVDCGYECVDGDSFVNSYWSSITWTKVCNFCSPKTDTPPETTQESKPDITDYCGECDIDNAYSCYYDYVSNQFTSSYHAYECVEDSDGCGNCEYKCGLDTQCELQDVGTSTGCEDTQTCTKLDYSSGCGYCVDDTSMYRYIYIIYWIVWRYMNI